MNKANGNGITTKDMYKRTYGCSYDRSLSTVEIAKKIRGDIKAAVKAGIVPKGTKVSVRTSLFAGGSSISVNVTAFPVPFLNVSRLALELENPGAWHVDLHIASPAFERYTEAGRAVLDALSFIVGAYNHDGSNSQVDYFDVNFYAHVEFGYKLEAAVKEALTAA